MARGHLKPTPPVYQRIGANIRRLRLARNMKQEELATACKLGRTSIVNIEYGRQRVNLETLQVIAEVFGQDISELLNPLTGQVQIEVLVDGQPIQVSDEVRAVIMKEAAPC